MTQSHLMRREGLLQHHIIGGKKVRQRDRWSLEPPGPFRYGLAKFRICETAVQDKTMAKPTTQKIRLVSTAKTGFFYVTKKNARTMTDKLTLKKYDPVVRKHVEFKEAKIK